jgi:hypothetical protein
MWQIVWTFLHKPTGEFIIVGYKARNLLTGERIEHAYIEQQVEGQRSEATQHNQSTFMARA